MGDGRGGQVGRVQHCSLEGLQELSRQSCPDNSTSCAKMAKKDETYGLVDGHVGLYDLVVILPELLYLPLLLVLPVLKLVRLQKVEHARPRRRGLHGRICPRFGHKGRGDLFLYSSREVKMRLGESGQVGRRRRAVGHGA